MPESPNPKFQPAGKGRSGIRLWFGIQLALRMGSDPIIQTITSGSEQRMNVPAVTVDGFFMAHAKTLQLKLEGSDAGFGRRIREPTINRPGLALAGFYEYFAE